MIVLGGPFRSFGVLFLGARNWRVDPRRNCRLRPSVSNQKNFRNYSPFEAAEAGSFFRPNALDVGNSFEKSIVKSVGRLAGFRAFDPRNEKGVAAHLDHFFLVFNPRESHLPGYLWDPRRRG